MNKITAIHSFLCNLTTGQSHWQHMQYEEFSLLALCVVSRLQLWPCLQDKFLPTETHKENLDLDLEIKMQVDALRPAPQSSMQTIKP